MGPHYRAPHVGRKPLVPYGRIAEVFIAAVRRGEWPVATTARTVGVDKLWLERRLWEVRRAGWLPKGASPLPGSDPTEWLVRAEALLAERRRERSSLQQQFAFRRELARDAARARRREKYSNERALIAPSVVMDRFGLF